MRDVVGSGQSLDPGYRAHSFSTKISFLMHAHQGVVLLNNPAYLCAGRTGRRPVRSDAGSGIQGTSIFYRDQFIDACLKLLFLGSFAVSRKGFRAERASRRADAECSINSGMLRSMRAQGVFLHA